MAEVTVHNLIAAIRPEVYCKAEVEKEGVKTSPRKEVLNLIGEEKKKIEEKIKKKLKEGKSITDADYETDIYLKAAEIAVPVESEFIDLQGKMSTPPKAEKEIVKAKFLDNPIEKHNLIYEALGSSLEPVYFWLLDRAAQEYDSEPPYKFTDNFASTVGSTQFTEMAMRARTMQDEAMKILGGVNQVIKAVVQITYDLKEFQIRLKTYEESHSSDEAVKEAALLSLKQIWLDTVDVKRGNTSIKGLALGAQANFATLIDAFMTLKSLDDVNKLDLNERVKKILEQRYPEFLNWTKISEDELSKRYKIERNYLLSQYNTVQMYMKWLKPYLGAARQLEQRAEPTASFVQMFNTTLLELSFFAQKKYNSIEDVWRGDFPEKFKNKILRGQVRTYYEMVVVEFKFRSIPERAGQSHIFKGTAEITFTSYALNPDEIELLKKMIQKKDFGDIIDLTEGMTGSLSILKESVGEFIEEAKAEQKEEQPKSASSLLNSIIPPFGKTKKQEEDEKAIAKIGKFFPKPDGYEEKAIRSQTTFSARKRCFEFYELYKKTNSMPTWVG